MSAFKRFLLSASSCLMMAAAHGQTFPDKPITWVVPFPPGGTTDVVARVVSAYLGKELGQPVIIDNRAGAGGSIGALLVARAAPDGYTIGMATVSTHAVNPACNPKLQYDPLKDFEAVTDVAHTANVLTVNNRFPANTFTEFLAEIRKEPGKYSYASTGYCGGMHMMGELFKVVTQTSIVHVPYRGAGPALNDLIGGQVSIMFDNLPSSVGHIKAGTIRAIAIASEKRFPGLPGVPTFKELGLSELNEPAWYGVVAPAKTPAAVIARLNLAFKSVLALPEVRSKLSEYGAEAIGNSPTEFTKEIRTELERMRFVVKKQGISFNE